MSHATRRACGATIIGGLIGWSGYALYGDLAGHLSPLLAAGLVALYLAACTALAVSGLRLSRRRP